MTTIPPAEVMRARLQQLIEHGRVQAALQMPLPIPPRPHIPPPITSTMSFMPPQILPVWKTSAEFAVARAGVAPSSTNPFPVQPAPRLPDPAPKADPIARPKSSLTRPSKSVMISESPVLMEPTRSRTDYNRSSFSGTGPVISAVSELDAFTQRQRAASSVERTSSTDSVQARSSAAAIEATRQRAMSWQQASQTIEQLGSPRVQAQLQRNQDILDKQLMMTREVAEEIRRTSPSLAPSLPPKRSHSPLTSHQRASSPVVSSRISPNPMSAPAIDLTPPQEEPAKHNGISANVLLDGWGKDDESEMNPRELDEESTSNASDTGPLSYQQLAMTSHVPTNYQSISTPSSAPVQDSVLLSPDVHELSSSEISPIMPRKEPLFRTYSDAGQQEPITQYAQLSQSASLERAKQQEQQRQESLQQQAYQEQRQHQRDILQQEQELLEQHRQRELEEMQHVQQQQEQERLLHQQQQIEEADAAREIETSNGLPRPDAAAFYSQQRAMQREQDQLRGRSMSVDVMALRRPNAQMNGTGESPRARSPSLQKLMSMSPGQQPPQTILAQLQAGAQMKSWITHQLGHEATPSPKPQSAPHPITPPVQISSSSPVAPQTPYSGNIRYSPSATEPARTNLPSPRSQQLLSNLPSSALQHQQSFGSRPRVYSMNDAVLPRSQSYSQRPSSPISYTKERARTPDPEVDVSEIAAGITERNAARLSPIPSQSFLQPTTFQQHQPTLSLSQQSQFPSDQQSQISQQSSTHGSHTQVEAAPFQPANLDQQNYVPGGIRVGETVPAIVAPPKNGQQYSADDLAMRGLSVESMITRPSWSPGADARTPFDSLERLLGLLKNGKLKLANQQASRSLSPSPIAKAPSRSGSPFRFDDSHRRQSPFDLSVRSFNAVDRVENRGVVSVAAVSDFLSQHRTHIPNDDRGRSPSPAKLRNQGRILAQPQVQGKPVSARVRAPEPKAVPIPWGPAPPARPPPTDLPPEQNPPRSKPKRPTLTTRSIAPIPVDERPQWGKRQPSAIPKSTRQANKPVPARVILKEPIPKPMPKPVKQQPQPLVSASSKIAATTLQKDYVETLEVGYARTIRLSAREQQAAQQQQQQQQRPKTAPSVPFSRSDFVALAGTLQEDDVEESVNISNGYEPIPISWDAPLPPSRPQLPYQVSSQSPARAAVRSPKRDSRRVEWPQGQQGKPVSTTQSDNSVRRGESPPPRRETPQQQQRYQFQHPVVAQSTPDVAPADRLMRRIALLKSSQSQQ